MFNTAPCKFKQKAAQIILIQKPIGYKPKGRKQEPLKNRFRLPVKFVLLYNLAQGFKAVKMVRKIKRLSANKTR